MHRMLTLLTVCLIVTALALCPACRPSLHPDSGARGSPETGDTITSAVRPRSRGATAASGGTPERSMEIMILCDTSFGPPVEKLAAMYEEKTGIKAAISCGRSEDLLRQVELGSRGDMFVTHDPYIEYAENANAMLRWIHVGYMAPVLVVQKGNPKNLKAVEDLAKPGLQVLLPNPEYSTCGEMVFALLKEKEIKDAVLKNVGNAMSRSHLDIGNEMELGTGDAAIMWNSVAHRFLDDVEIVPTPYEYEKEIRVGVIGLAYTNKRALVELFLELVGERGQAVFREYGYVK